MLIEQSLIDLIKVQDRKAQEQVYKLLYQDAFRFALRYTKNDDDAKDIINQSFFNVFTKIDQFKGDGKNFYGWVKKILVNKALDYIKSVAVKNSFLPIEEAENHILVEEELTNIDEASIIKLIQMLPFTSSCVFNLFAIEGYSHKEISEMLNITETNSKYHLHSARQKLKNWLFKSEIL